MTKKTKNPAVIAHTLQAWADAASMDPSTIKRALARLDYKPVPHELIPFTVIRRALFGDFYLARLKGQELLNAKLEVETEIARKSVIPREDVATFIRNTFSPVREDIVSLPGQLAARCNPADPQKARDALTEWSDTFLRRRRENLPQFETK